MDWSTGKCQDRTAKERIGKQYWQVQKPILGVSYTGLMRTVPGGMGGAWYP